MLAVDAFLEVEMGVEEQSGGDTLWWYSHDKRRIGARRRSSGLRQTVRGNAAVNFA